MGPDFIWPRAVILIDDTTALVADSGADAIFRVDLTTGDRTSAYNDVPLAVPDDLLIRNDRLLILDRGTRKVLTYDLAEENLIGSALLPTTIKWPKSLGNDFDTGFIVDTAADTVWITDPENTPNGGQLIVLGTLPSFGLIDVAWNRYFESAFLNDFFVIDSQLGLSVHSLNWPVTITALPPPILHSIATFYQQS